MKMIPLKTQQQKDGLEAYNLFCKEKNIEPLLQNFIGFYRYWCIDSHLFYDMSLSQHNQAINIAIAETKEKPGYEKPTFWNYEEEEKHCNALREANKKSVIEEQKVNFRAAYWKSDDGWKLTLLTHEDDKRLSHKNLFALAVAEYKENHMRDEYDIAPVYDFCTHCEKRESDVDYVHVMSQREYCDDCGELKKGFTKDYCTETGKTKLGCIVIC